MKPIRINQSLCQAAFRSAMSHTGSSEPLFIVRLQGTEKYTAVAFTYFDCILHFFGLYTWATGQELIDLRTTPIDLTTIPNDANNLSLLSSALEKFGQLSTANKINSYIQTHNLKYDDDFDSSIHPWHSQDFMLGLLSPSTTNRDSWFQW